MRHPPNGNQRRTTSFWQRLTAAWLRVASMTNLGVVGIYVGVAALIGVDGLVAVLALTAMWPVAIPLVLGTLALVYYFRQHLRARWRRLPPLRWKSSPRSSDQRG